MKATSSGKTRRRHQRKRRKKEKPDLLQDLFILGTAVIIVKNLIGT